VRRLHIALVIESSRGYGRDLLSGIARYAREHGPWSISWQDRGMTDPIPEWLARWKGDGVIARVENAAMERAIRRLNLPVVDVRGSLDLDWPRIDTDNRLVAEMAADHLLERGFKHFAYCGFAGVDYSMDRQAHFPPYLAKCGFNCIVYQGPRRAVKGDQSRKEQHGIQFERELAIWVKSLPRPIGVMCCNDLRAQQLLNACRAVNIAVPEDVAIVGVDNDELLCELADPPLSSVQPDAKRIGYRAAAKLHSCLRGGNRKREREYVPPLRVFTRHSTDILAIDDHLVARAVRYIREHATEGINVDDVLRQLVISRVTLNRRFEKVLGRSPKDEIDRVRLQRVKQLLLETDFSLARIADLSGFKHPEYLSVVFKSQTGQTASKFRQRGQRMN
jgi:LacI family transcriptional regulator